MAQVTGAMSFRQASVDIGANSGSVTELDSMACAVRVTGGSRETGEAHTFDGDFPVVGAGKSAGLDVEVRYVYTEGGSDAFETARARYEAAGAACYLQFSPKGDGTGANFRYSTASPAGVKGSGIMTELLYPSGEAEGGAIVIGAFTVHCPRLLKGTCA